MEGVVRVLLVEDETRLAETVRRGLVAEGFVVDVEHDGVDGLAAAATGDFDVVVLDIMLPGLSGYQIVRQLRTRQVWTPVLMLSAKDGEYPQLVGSFQDGQERDRWRLHPNHAPALDQSLRPCAEARAWS